MYQILSKPNVFTSSSDSTKSLTSRYILALSSVAILAIIGQLLIHQIIENQLADSRVVNIAGKQRYKSQEICKLVFAIQLHYHHPLYHDKAASLKALLASWEKEHNGLVRGDADLNLPGNNSGEITSMFTNLDPDFYIIRDNALLVADLSADSSDVSDMAMDKSVREVMEREYIFLTKMNAIVHQYEEEAKDKVITLRRIEIILLIITLTILTLEGFFIFRPAVFKIKETIQNLTASEKNALQLANELTLANNVLKDSYEREQKIRSASLIEGQENERKTIAMELHDSIGQYLMTMKYKIEDLSPANNSDEADKKYELQQLVKQTIQDTRKISFNLMPSILTDFGLATALKSLSDNISHTSGISIDFENTSAFKRLKSIAEINLYRIVQESLSNAVKYSEADEIQIKLFTKGEAIVLTVYDNGKGFDTAALKNEEHDRIKSGNGMSNIKERALMLSGSVTIESLIGEGTKVTVAIPFHTNTIA